MGAGVIGAVERRRIQRDRHQVGTEQQAGFEAFEKHRFAWRQAAFAGSIARNKLAYHRPALLNIQTNRCPSRHTLCLVFCNMVIRCFSTAEENLRLVVSAHRRQNPIISATWAINYLLQVSLVIHGKKETARNENPP